MSKYKKAVDQMMTDNKEVFDNFLDIHREYDGNPQEWQKLFNQYGGEVVDIMRDYERKLCATMEGGKYGRFSTGVSEKFWEEIKKIFPKIHFVGVKMD